MRGAAPESHRHRIPLGLAMLDHGWITTRQLREALEAQKATGGGRLGEWLVSQKAVSEDLVTRALGLQWSCPVLGIDCHDAEAMTALLPRIFVETFRALPLRVAAGRILYLGFESRPDPVLALAIERMTGLRVETGLVQGSSFRPAHARMLAAHHQPEGIAESVSDISLAGSLLHALECARPADARLVRVHDCLWLRMWMRPAKGYASDPGSIEDLICPTPGRYDAQADPTSAEHP
jgi:hypothetical protein